MGEQNLVSTVVRFVLLCMKHNNCSCGTSMCVIIGCHLSIWCCMQYNILVHISIYHKSIGYRMILSYSDNQYDSYKISMICMDALQVHIFRVLENIHTMIFTVAGTWCACYDLHVDRSVVVCMRWSSRWQEHDVHANQSMLSWTFLYLWTI